MVKILPLALLVLGDDYRRILGPKSYEGKVRIASAHTVHGHESKLARAERSAGSAKLHRIEDAMHLLGMTTAARTTGRKPRGYESLKTLDDVRHMLMDNVLNPN